MLGICGFLLFLHINAIFLIDSFFFFWMIELNHNFSFIVNHSSIVKIGQLLSKVFIDVFVLLCTSRIPLASPRALEVSCLWAWCVLVASPPLAVSSLPSSCIIFFEVFRYWWNLPPAPMRIDYRAHSRCTSNVEPVLQTHRACSSGCSCPSWTLRL